MGDVNAPSFTFRLTFGRFSALEEREVRFIKIELETNFSVLEPSMEQFILDTNAGKQQSQATTYV
jgi:hypothetical protein